jgi:hypothetical protein
MRRLFAVYLDDPAWCAGVFSSTLAFYFAAVLAFGVLP